MGEFMNLELLETFLLYSLGFNCLVVTLWFLVFTFAHDWLYQLHSRWFQIPLTQFDGLHYAGMMMYKLCIYFFNVAPLVALWIMHTA
jgi:hypothetical protein